MLGLGLNIFTLAIRRYFGGGGGQFAGSSLNLDFTSGNQSLDPRITFTRASTGTRINASGVLVSEAINGPRFDYDPVTLAPKGLLIEEQRTNSIRNSTMVGAVAGTPGTLPTNWSFIGQSGISSQVIGSGVEDGINYVDVRVFGIAGATGNNSTAFEAVNGIAASNGQTWTASVNARIVGGSTTGLNSVRILVSERGSGGGYLADTQTSIAVTSGPLKAQRYQSTRTLNNVSTAFVTASISANVPSGNTVDITLRIGLPQLELGAFATSPIPTTTAAATRAADVAVMTGANFSNWYRQDEGTFYSDAIGVPGASNVSFVANANDGTSNNFVDAARYQPTLRIFVRVNAGLSTSILSGQSGGVYRKAATAFSASDLAFCVDGGVPSTAALTALPVVSRLDIGSDGSGVARYLNGHIRRIGFFPRRLTNSELQGLTS